MALRAFHFPMNAPEGSNKQPYEDRTTGWPKDVERELEAAANNWPWLMSVAAIGSLSYFVVAVVSAATDWSVLMPLAEVLGIVGLASAVVGVVTSQSQVYRIAAPPKLSVRAAGPVDAPTWSNSVGRLSAPEIAVLRGGARVGDRKIASLALKELLVSEALVFRHGSYGEEATVSPGQSYGAKFRPPLEAVLAIYSQMADVASGPQRTSLRALLYRLFNTYSDYTAFGGDSHVLALLEVLPALEAAGLCAPVYPAERGRVSEWELTGLGQAIQRELRARPPEDQELRARVSDDPTFVFSWIDVEVKKVWKDIYRE